MTLIKTHHHEYPMEDIRYSLVELGYTYDEAESLIDEALYGHRNKAARSHQKLAWAGGASILAGIAITLVALVNDTKTWVRPTETVLEPMDHPSTVKEALAAYDAGDYEKALKLLKPFAEEGDPKAQMLLGSLYDNGDGISYDHAQAATWYKKAATQGHLQAQTLLGEMYLKGRGVEQNEEEGARWMIKAAQQGSMEAQSQTAELYFKGIGVTQSFKEAAKWYRKAAERGNVDAQSMMSMLYSNGQGVVQDFSKAGLWAKKAATQGDPKAQTILGILYSTGQGVPKDLSESYKWLTLAHAAGNAAAQPELARLETQMTPEQVQQARDNASQLLHSPDIEP